MFSIHFFIVALCLRINSDCDRDEKKLFIFQHQSEFIMLHEQNKRVYIDKDNNNSDDPYLR